MKTGSNLIVPARPRDFVTDRAGVLSTDAARALNGELMQFEKETSNQVIVFIDRRIPAETTLEELASNSIHQWGVGQRGKDNGVIFFVFADDHKLRIEVGYGLESALTDARASRIINGIVKPLAQRGKLAEGIVIGTEAIMDVARGGEAAEAFAPQQRQEQPLIRRSGSSRCSHCSRRLPCDHPAHPSQSPSVSERRIQRAVPGELRRVGRGRGRLIVRMGLFELRIGFGLIFGRWRGWRRWRRQWIVVILAAQSARNAPAPPSSGPTIRPLSSHGGMAGV